MAGAVGLELKAPLTLAKFLIPINGHKRDKRLIRLTEVHTRYTRN
jgi:hypothetical protein